MENNVQLPDNWDEGSASPDPGPYGLRHDGTAAKGPGYLGPLLTPEGGVATELSIGVNIDGKETDVPSLVPTLTQQEIDSVVSGGAMTPSIIQKATEHARKRIAQGKSPFLAFNESQALVGPQASAVQAEKAIPESLAGVPSKGAVEMPQDYHDVQQEESQQMVDLILPYSALVQSVVRSSPDAAALEDNLDKITSSAYLADRMKMDFNYVFANHDEVAKEYWGRVTPAKSGAQAVKEAWRTGILNQYLDIASYKQMMGDNSPMLVQQMDLWKRQVPDPDVFARSAPTEVFKAAAGMLPWMWENWKFAATRSAAVATAAAGLGLLAGPGAEVSIPAIWLSTFMKTMKWGSAVYNFQSMAGAQYRVLTDAGISPDIARTVSIPVGAVQTLIMGFTMKNIPGAAGLEKKVLTITKALEEGVLKDAVMGGKLAALANHYVTGAQSPLMQGARRLGVETAKGELVVPSMVLAQQAVGIMAESIATNWNNATQGTDIPQKTKDEILKRFLDTYKQTALAMLALSPVGAVGSAWAQYRRGVKLAGAFETAKGEAARAEAEMPSAGKTQAERQADMRGPPLELPAVIPEKTAAPVQARGKVASPEAKPTIMPKEVVRGPGGTLHTEVEVRSQLREGTRETIKAGDPATGERYGYVNYDVTGDAVHIDEVVSEAKKDVTRELVLTLAAKNPGKVIIWDHPTEAQIPIHEQIVADNPRGQGEGLQWFDAPAQPMQGVTVAPPTAEVLPSAQTVRTPEQVSARDAFIEEVVSQFSMDPAQKQLAGNLIDAIALNAGKTPDEWISQFKARAGTAPQEKGALGHEAQAGILFQTPEGEYIDPLQVDQAEFKDRLSAVIVAAEGSDFHHFIAEFVHMVERMGLSEEQKALMEKAVGKPRASMTVDDLEMIADNFEEYMGSGKAPSPELETLFQKFAALLRQIYSWLKEHFERIGKPMSPEFVKAFDSWFSKPESGASKSLVTDPAKADVARYADIGLSEVEARIVGANKIPIGQLFHLKTPEWFVDYSDREFAEVNNRLSKELQVVEHILGDAGGVVKEFPVRRNPDGTFIYERGIAPQDLNKIIYDNLPKFRKLFDASVTPEDLAKEMKADLSQVDEKGKPYFYVELDALRNGKALLDDDIEDDTGMPMLSDNGKAGKSVDFLLSTCHPTTPCKECYAARAYIRMASVRKGFRNTLHVLIDPLGFAQKVADEVNSMSYEKLPFVRLLGSGDITSTEQVRSFNRLAQLIDRPLHIFSRHHEMLELLKSGPNAPFIKMGSLDSQLYDIYGRDYLIKNLEERGIVNAFLYDDPVALTKIKDLYDNEAIGLVLSANHELHNSLPPNIQSVSCPCDAGERTYCASCRRCALENAGCFMSLVDKGVDDSGKVWKISDPAAPDSLRPILSFKGVPAKSWSEVAQATIKKSMQLIDLNIRKFNHGETSAIALKDVRYPDDITIVDNVEAAQSYKENLKGMLERAKRGTFKLPGGKIQPERRFYGWVMMTDPDEWAKGFTAEDIARWHAESKQAEIRSKMLGHKKAVQAPVMERPEVVAFNARAEKTFGTTDDPTYAAWILSNGKMLDFQGTQRGVYSGEERSGVRVAHKTIEKALPSQKGDTYLNTYRRAWDVNAVRMDFNRTTSVIQSIKPPNAQQMATIKGWLSDTRSIQMELVNPETGSPTIAYKEIWNPTAQNVEDFYIASDIYAAQAKERVLFHPTDYVPDLVSDDERGLRDHLVQMALPYASAEEFQKAIEDTFGEGKAGPPEFYAELWAEAHPEAPAATPVETKPSIPSPVLPEEYDFAEKASAARDAEDPELARGMATGEISTKELEGRVEKLEASNTALKEKLKAAQVAARAMKGDFAEGYENGWQWRAKIAELEAKADQMDASDKLKAARMKKIAEKWEKVDEVKAEIQAKARERRALVKYRQAIKKVIRKIMEPPSLAVSYRGYAEEINRMQRGMDAARHHTTTGKPTIWEEEREASRKFFAGNSEAAKLVPEKKLEKMYSTSLGDKPLAELEDILETIEQLRDMGKMKRSLQTKQKLNRRKGAIALVSETVRRGKPLEVVIGAAKKTGLAMRAWMAGLKPDRIVKLLDGIFAGKKNGENERLLQELPNEAWKKASKMKHARKQAVIDVMNKLKITADPLAFRRVAGWTYIGADLDLEYQGKTFVMTDGKKPTIQKAMYWYAGIQNDRTRAALLKGENYPEEVMLAGIEAIKKMPGVIEFADAIRKDLNDNFPRVREAYIDGYNQDLPAEEWYVPMFRTEFDYTDRADNVADELTGRTGLSKQFVARGMTHVRVDVPDSFQKPIRDDLFSVWLTAVDMQEDFIHQDQLVKELHSIYGSAEVKHSIQQHFGPEMNSWVLKYINALAGEDSYSQLIGVEKWSRFMRKNAAIAWLSFNLLTILKQLTGFINGLADAGPLHLICSAAQFAGSMGKSLLTGKLLSNTQIDFVEERSELVRHRSPTQELEDLKTVDAKLYAQIINKVGSMGMKSLAVIDKVTCVVVWKAVYDKTEGSEAEKIDAADKAIVRTQPSMRVQDMAEIFRAGEGLKWFTMFGSENNVTYNRLTFDVPAALRNGQVLHAAADLLSFAMGGLGIALASGALHGDDPEKKKKKLLTGIFSQYFEAIPILGNDIFSLIQRSAGVGKSFQGGGVKFIPALTYLNNIPSQLKKGDLESAFTNFAEAVGFAVGLPVSGPRRILKTIKTGDAEQLLGWPVEKKE